MVNSKVMLESRIKWTGTAIPIFKIPREILVSGRYVAEMCSKVSDFRLFPVEEGMEIDCWREFGKKRNLDLLLTSYWVNVLK